MNRRRRAHGGYSLIEVVVSIAIIALFSAGAYASLTASIGLNARTQAMLDAELHVKSAVEERLAKGISKNEIQRHESSEEDEGYYYIDHDGSVRIILQNPTESASFYETTFQALDADSQPVKNAAGEPVEVKINIKAIPEQEAQEP